MLAGTMVLFIAAMILWSVVEKIGKKKNKTTV